MQRREEDNRYLEKLVAVNRVSKTVKGGRNMRFKAVEIPEAIRKGLEEAKKTMVTIPLNGTTIPHEVVGVFGTGKVKMLPAPEGTGVIAGGPVRAVLEAAGIKDIVTKSIGSNNKINMVRATLAGLKQLRSAEQVAAMRGKTVEELLG